MIARLASLFAALLLATFGSLMAGHGAGLAEHDDRALSAAVTVNTSPAESTEVTATGHHASPAVDAASPGPGHASDACAECLTQDQLHLLAACGLLVMSAISLLLLPRWLWTIHRAADPFAAPVLNRAPSESGHAPLDLFSIGVCRR